MRRHMIHILVDDVEQSSFGVENESGERKKEDENNKKHLTHGFFFSSRVLHSSKKIKLQLAMCFVVFYPFVLLLLLLGH
jgi:hypothetical protein